MLTKSNSYLQSRTAPDWIHDLLPGQIFVFGSNTVGNHKKGAAKTAIKWGAIWGQAAGLQGRTYGIPTKPRNMKQVLTIPQIQKYVDDFVEFARLHPELTFLVTEIGCGLAHYKVKQIAPLFIEAANLDNVHMTSRFWQKLMHNHT